MKNAIVFYHKWSKSLGFLCKMHMCAFTHENPGTRHCTIHPRTLTTTPTKNTTKSRQFRTHLYQSRNCLYLLSRISVCALLNLCWSIREWVVAARGRRWTWRLWRALCRRASRRVPSPKTVGGQAAVLVHVLLQSSEETRRHDMSVGAHGV